MGAPGTTEQELISTLHYAIHTELTLDRALSDVWPVFQDMQSWYTEYAFKTVSGPPYEAGSGLLEGQVLEVTSSHPFPRAANSKSTGPEPFVVKIIKVDPPHEMVAVLSGRAFDWKRYTAFYLWRLTGDARQTTIHVDSVGETELENPLTEAEFSEYDDALTENWHRSWSQAFENLRRMMEA